MRYLFLSLLFLVPTLAYGASFESVLLTTNPEHPRPGAEVVVTATLVGTDPKITDFVWEVDGEVVGQGSNMPRLSVTAPQSGIAREVSVSIAQSGVAVGSATLTIRPALVTLEWESLGTRPPFYIGRPLPAARGGIVAHAVPSLIRGDGSTVSSRDILYTWSIDGRVQPGSGYGRETFRTTPPFFNEPYRLGVTATSRDGLLRAEAALGVMQRLPDIVLYELSPLAGLRDERAIVGSYPFGADEVSFKAYPLHVEDPASLTVLWTLDGETLTLETGDPLLAVFRKTGAGAGSYEVGISFSHVSDFLRRASSAFLLTF